MMLKTGHGIVACVLVLGLLAGSWAQAGTRVITHGSTTVTMEFVDIGDAGNAADTLGDPNPAGSVAYDYAIGKYEVTDDQWDAVSEASAVDALDNTNGWFSGKQPAGNLSWHEAAMFCNWLTSGDVTKGAYTISGGVVTAIDRATAGAMYGTVYALPTEDEWYKAAYYDAGGTTYYLYPAGSSTMPAQTVGGTTANTAVYGYGAGAPADVDNAGGTSPYGAMAMGGNIWEWSETLVGGGNAVVRGAAFWDIEGWMRRDSRLTAAQTALDPAFGLRIASIYYAPIPLPSSLVLLICGLAGLMVRMRRRTR